MRAGLQAVFDFAATEINHPGIVSLSAVGTRRACPKRRISQSLRLQIREIIGVHDTHRCVIEWEFLQAVHIRQTPGFKTTQAGFVNSPDIVLGVAFGRVGKALAAAAEFGASRAAVENKGFAVLVLHNLAVKPGVLVFPVPQVIWQVRFNLPQQVGHGVMNTVPFCTRLLAAKIRPLAKLIFQGQALAVKFDQSEHFFFAL